MDFTVNRGGGDLHAQIEKQIEYYIAVGQLVIGDRLPTIRELEKQLGINRHTIRRAYLNLANRGLLQVRRGSGVTVAARLPAVKVRRQDAKLAQLVESTLDKATRLGYSSISFARILQTKALELDRRNPSIAFAECSDSQAHDLAIALGAHLGQAVLPVTIGLTGDDEFSVPESVQWVVVPVFHADQIQDALKGTRVQIITARVEVGLQFRLKAARMLPTERPCIIIRDQDSVALLPNVVRRILGLKREVVPAVMGNRRKCLKIVEHSDLVFYTVPCREFVEEVVPPNKKKHEVSFEFTQDALEIIKRTVRI
jgi:DNA-binding transcriptional regulator YhcF (GntR family)